MGIDEESERPAEQAAGDATKAGQNSTQVAAPSATADKQVTGDAVTGDAVTGDAVTGDAVTGDREPETDGHTEEWRANASKAAEKIRAMFKS